MKKRYCKKRNDLETVKQSRAGLPDVVKLDKLLKPYNFFDWLNHFLKLRNDTLSNFRRLKNEDMEASSDGEGKNVQVE